ncbi:MAG: hypothetical protein JW793_00545, partial [Acidobacteria bacterium]|nr:hypothetical protein [Acidobacteriota bacterium]
ICNEEPPPEMTSRDIRAGDETTVSRESYRWTTGPTWNYRLLLANLEVNDQSRDYTDYIKAEEKGLVKRLSFGLKIRILKVKPGFKYWATMYEIEVLEGPLVGQTGWVDYESLADHSITEIIRK